MLQSHRHNTQEASHSSGGLVTLSPGTFLVHPDSADRCLGRSQFWAMFKKDLLVFVLLVFLGGASLLISLQGLRPLLLVTQIQQSGISALGTIVGQRTAPMGTRGESTAYYLKYQFTALSGETSAGEQVVSQQTFKRFQLGDSVLVQYLPDNPGLAVLVGSAKDYVLDFGNLLIALTGGIGLCGAIGLIVFFFWQMWREEQFFTRGQLIMGHVLACHGHLKVASQPSDVELHGPGLGGQYLIDLSYRFRAPDGKSIKSTVERQRNDLRGCHLPKFGHPVAILYLNEKRHKIL